MKEEKYYNFQNIMKFLGFDYNFDKSNNKGYPFSRGKDNVEFGWGQILIPKYGIRQMVQNKISNIPDKPINEIVMMYQIPFITEGSTGIINQNISLSFEYGKEYKYGEITRSIYECCFWILENSVRTNDFYIIEREHVQEFFSYCIICNQWGLGTMKVCSSPQEKFGKELSVDDEVFKTE